MTSTDDRRMLYIIACAAPPATQVDKLVTLAQDNNGWEVAVIATPQATKFIDRGRMEDLTGHVVRSEYKQPDAPDVLPPPDAIVVAPVPSTRSTMGCWDQ